MLEGEFANSSESESDDEMYGLMSVKQSGLNTCEEDSIDVAWNNLD
jgi:hypothetical protein